ncbi:hypothetical protein LOC51_08650 [Rubrivivax sp. JA1024]|nr:hypothetical protein [Rubrivivax sp. JA1024]
MSDPFAPLGGDGSRGGGDAKGWVTIVPVPGDAPTAPGKHPKLGAPALRWTYRDAGGELLGYVLRFDQADGGKVFRPLTYGRPWAGGDAAWRWESWATPRPLYGLDRLAERPDAEVVVAEGEKAADAVQRLLVDVVAVTSPNGSKSASKAAWAALRGRRVIIWPDADAAGLAYAQAVGKATTAAGAASVAIVSPPDGYEPGWDAADAEAAGWDAARARALVDAAKAFKADHGPAGGGDASSGGRRRRVPQRDVLIAATEFCELWHDDNRQAYASFPVNGHTEHWPIRSRDFRMWLSSRYFEETGTAIGSQALEDGLRIMEARAVNEGPEHKPFMRVGRSNGSLYVDLADKDWQAIEITGKDWRIVQRPPVKLCRSSSMRPLMPPEGGAMIERLRQFINASDDDFMLVVAWLVMAIHDRGPFPVLVLNGEQGSGKSTVSRMLRSLIDPAAAPIRSVSKDGRDLVVSASNSWILCFDNLSKMEPWFSDALCQISNGLGFATRQLHTDREEAIFEAARPIILNGIPSLTDRGDLASRAVVVHLLAIPEDQRRPEDEILAEFNEARPEIIGALCDAAVAALANYAKVRLPRAPRMADFVKWITAASPGLGWGEGEFLDAYDRNRKGVNDSAFEADSVAVIIASLVQRFYPDGLECTPAELLEKINERATEALKRQRSWPLTPQAMGNRLERVAPLLKQRGFTVEKRRSASRTIIIVPPPGSWSTPPGS